MPFLFASAIDPSCPTLAGGARLDQLDRTGHYARWEEDLERTRTLGLDALCYGAPYYRAHLAPDHHDWECVEEPLLRLRDLGVDVIADLCRFGVPSWLGGFQDPAFPVLFAEYARAFARRFHWVRHYTPVSDIMQCAMASALRGEWNECERSDSAFVRSLRNLCMAHELAVEAILSERRDAVIVHRECEAPPPPPGTEAGESGRWEALRHLALDLTLGHELAPGAGAYLQRHGVPSNELSFFRETRAFDRRWLGVDATAAMHARYRRPLFVLAHARAPESGAAALHASWEALVAVRAGGAPVHGFAWTALVDSVGFERGASVAGNAVYADGLCTPSRHVSALGEEFALLMQRWRPDVGAAPAALSAQR